jgi:hypothetical protein
VVIEPANIFVDVTASVWISSAEILFEAIWLAPIASAIILEPDMVAAAILEPVIVAEAIFVPVIVPAEISEPDMALITKPLTMAFNNIGS